MVSLAQATFVTAGGFAAGWAVNHDCGVDIPFIARHGQINFAVAAVLGALAAAALGRADRAARAPARRARARAGALASRSSLDLMCSRSQDVSNGTARLDVYPLPDVSTRSGSRPSTSSQAAHRR